MGEASQQRVLATFLALKTKIAAELGEPHSMYIIRSAERPFCISGKTLTTALLNTRTCVGWHSMR